MANYQCGSTSDLWNQLKGDLKYENDPHDQELIHSLPALMEDNYHGRPGFGDCDDMAIATATVALANGYDTELAFVGNSRRAPSHVYCIVNGVPIDFTAGAYGVERPYKYKTTTKITV